MACNDCLTKSQRFNMRQICCIARHVLYRFYGADESAKQYVIELAKNYKVDVNELREAVKLRLNKKREMT